MDKAKILKEIIEQKYTSVKEFAQYCDLPYTTVYTILKNGVGKANVNNIIVMCKKLNITVEQLYNMADNNNSTNFQPVKTIANDLECTSYNTKKNDKDSINALDLLKQTYHLSKLEYAIIKGYSELSKEQRYTFEKFIQNIIYDIVDPIGNSIIKDAKNDLDNLKKSKSKNQKELG